MVGGPSALWQHGKANPDKVFGDHEDPAFYKKGAKIGTQIKDPAFMKVADAAEDAEVNTKRKHKQHKAVKKPVRKKRAAKKKPALKGKALKNHIAHIIAKAEKKKRKSIIRAISREGDRRMAYDMVGGPSEFLEDPDLNEEQKKKLVSDHLADRPMANKIVDSVTGHGGKIDDQWNTKKKKKAKKKKKPTSTLQKEKRALAEGARYQRMGKKTHKKASAHKGKKHSKSVKMKASKHGILKGVAKKGMKALIKKAVKKAVKKKKKKKKGKKKKKAHKKAKKSTKKKKKGVFPPFS